MFVVLFALVPVLHAYVGMRLLPDLSWGQAGFWIGVVVLIASSLLIPLGMLSRRMPQPRADLLAWTGFVLMGAFSSVLVLTFLRDLALTAAAFFDLVHPNAWLDQPLPGFRRDSARRARPCGTADAARLHQCTTAAGGAPCGHPHCRIAASPARIHHCADQRPQTGNQPSMRRAPL